MSSTDLRARRIALGASEETMSAGIGLRVADIREIERNEDSDDMLNHYATWLARMEKWPRDERDRQFLGASTGRLFVVGRS